MSLAVVGVGFANRDGSNRQFAIAECDPGEPVELRPEPKNKADERAVAVWSARGVQMGYLTAERCGRITTDGHQSCRREHIQERQDEAPRRFPFQAIVTPV